MLSIVVRVGNSTPIVETTELVEETEVIDYNTVEEFTDQLLQEQLALSSLVRRVQRQVATLRN